MNDQGTTLIGTSAGFLVFLVLLLGAVQITYDLYATSMVTAVARDAATSVAGFDAGPDRCAATAAASASLEANLGRSGREAGVRIDWMCDEPDVVRLRVVARHPSILPSGLAGLGDLGRVDRTIEVRVEAPR